MILFFFHFPKFFEDRPRSEGRNSFSCDLCLTVLLRFSSRCRRFFVSFSLLHMRSHPDTRTFPVTPRSHAHTQTTHPSILSLAHAIRSVGHLAPPIRGEAGEGKRSGRGLKMVAQSEGVLVRGDEPGSSALSPDIHTQWVHSHTVW